MQATLSELHRETRKIIRPVIHHGAEVVLTDFGKPVAKIIPYLPTTIYDDPEAARAGTLTDEAILQAVRESREEHAGSISARL